VNTQQVLKQYIIKELLNRDIELAEDDALLSTGKVDSLGMVRLLGFIEDHFQITVPPEDLIIENFATINIIANYLQQRSEQ